MKILILGVTFVYIYTKVSHFDERVLTGLYETLQTKRIGYLIFFVGLALCNWVLEIFKWQAVISPVKRIDFQEAAKQTLASLMVSLATPNRIGEYGAKVCYYPKYKWKEVVLLNFAGNLGQMLITLLFGGIGIYFIIIKYHIALSLFKITSVVLLSIGILISGYFYREKQWLVNGLSIKNMFIYINQLDDKVKFKILFLSLLRYLCFSYLFIELIWFFGSDIPFWEGYILILSMYLLSSLIPTIFIFDVIVKGGVALWLFSLAGVPELTVISTVISMWLLNFVGPSLIGSFYVATFNTDEI